jgi:hypothetical protein
VSGLPAALMQRAARAHARGFLRRKTWAGVRGDGYDGGPSAGRKNAGSRIDAALAIGKEAAHRCSVLCSTAPLFSSNHIAITVKEIVG